MEEKFSKLADERDELRKQIRRMAVHRDDRDPALAEAVARLAVVNHVIGVLLAELREPNEVAT